MSARRIGVTMGDPAGIVPEIILEALAELATRWSAYGSETAGEASAIEKTGSPLGTH